MKPEWEAESCVCCGQGQLWYQLHDGLCPDCARGLEERFGTDLEVLMQSYTLSERLYLKEQLEQEEFLLRCGEALL